MKSLLAVLFLTLSSFAATSILVSPERWDLSLTTAIHEAVGDMKDNCSNGDLSDAKVIRQWDVKEPTYTEYHVVMTATCTTKESK